MEAGKVPVPPMINSDVGSTTRSPEVCVKFPLSVRMLPLRIRDPRVWVRPPVIVKAEFS